MHAMHACDDARVAANFAGPNREVTAFAAEIIFAAWAYLDCQNFEALGNKRR